jgi:subtilisin family serine protease
MRRIALALAAAALTVPAGAAGVTSFVPNDPLAARQWYLPQIHAFDFWPDALPPLSPVRVAVIDSGLDLDHPEFAGRVAAAQSFVGGDATDREGHGTFVAGIIAASAGNGQGIAGIAFPAQLLIAKVVRPDGTISPDAEAKAIRWAADKGARVINLSLGGLRDPRDLKQDTYSRVEQQAVEYAYRHGAVLVAAVGNGDLAPKTPWDFASWPAALPHVIGVSALAQDGSVPSFSNLDQNFNDIAAPGVGIVSTLPRSITAQRPACPDQGYSPCGPLEFRTADGTSYAAAQVSAAAALLIATRPSLAPDQVSTLLERSATDVNAGTGCPKCLLQRDP